MRPLEDRLYVRREGPWGAADTELTVVEDKPPLEVGVVEAVGPGRLQRVKHGKTFRMERVPMEVEVGERVLFGRYAGTDVEVGLDAQHTLLTQGEVLAVIRPEPTVVDLQIDNSVLGQSTSL